MQCPQCGNQRPIKWVWFPFCGKKCHNKGAK